MHANFMALSSIELDFAYQSFTFWQYKTWHFFAAASLTLTRWPFYRNLTTVPSRCTHQPKVNFLHQVVQQLFITYMHTDRYHRKHDRAIYHVVTSRLLTTHEAAWYIILDVSVCMYVCQTNFKSLDVGSSSPGNRFAYEGHRVKVKVTGVKKC